LGHAASIVQAHDFQTVLESHRDDVPATRASANDLLRLAQKYGISVYAQQAQMYASWAHGRLFDADAGASGLRQAIGAYTAQGNKIGAPSFHGLLAELEATIKGPESALTLIDQALAIAEETGEHWTDPYLHRLRGDILLKRNSVDPAPAEEAFKTAIAIAKEQGARSYELLASLSLAKLYHSTGRTADAKAVLSPALEGFAPAPEMPEIAEAQALMERLA
jgi:predicted ATPase